jgi:hypothetical protein
MFLCSESIAALLAEDPRSRLLIYFTLAVQIATVTLTIEKLPDLDVRISCGYQLP